MRKLLAVFTVILAVCLPSVAQSPFTLRAIECGAGTLGGAAGALTAIALIADVGPQVDSRLAKTALVIGSLTVCSGAGSAAAVLAAARLLDADGDARGCLIGGLVGGFLSAFTEPLLYTLGVPASWTEFFGFLMLPILPAVGAVVGFN